jgi:hypothetical protein
VRQLLPLAALPLAALPLLNCVSSRSFSPTENATMPSPTGRAAAQYDVEAAEGELAHVEVWSQGAYTAKVDGVDATVLEVGMRVEPETDERAYLIEDSLTLDAVNLDEERLDELPPIRVDRAAMHDGTAAYTAFFRLPDGVGPGDIDSFRLKWRVKVGDMTYTQRTPFLQDYPTAYYAYGWGSPWYYSGFYSPYYNPFFYDPFYYPLYYPMGWRGGPDFVGPGAVYEAPTWVAR